MATRSTGEEAQGQLNVSLLQNRSESSSSIYKTRRRNVLLLQFSIFLVTIGFSISQWNLFDAYLSFLSKSLGQTYNNSFVGVAESISGATTLLLAIPVGMLVDKYSRTKLLKFGIILTVIASVWNYFAVYYDNVVSIFTNLVMWGVASELTSSASEALFADSVERGKSAPFATRGILSTIGLGIGPAITVGIFIYVGDNWTLTRLHVPILLGVAFLPIASAPVWWVKDPKPGQSQPNSPASPTSVHSLPQGPSSPLMRPQRIAGSPSPSPGPPPPVAQTNDDGHSVNLDAPGAKYVPYIVATSDLIRKIGAGMTTKFFPLFFINDYHFRPIDVSILYCAFPLSISLFIKMVQKATKPLGRPQAVVIWQILGIICLVLMVYTRNVWLMVFIFLVRGGFMNAPYPIDRSLVMDYVPSKHRGKWNAVESITSMTWSGSALLGGFLSDVHDYRYTFLFTAGIYSVALVVYLPLLWIIPRESSKAEDDGPTEPLEDVYEGKDDYFVLDGDTPLSEATSTTADPATGIAILSPNSMPVSNAK